MNNLHDLHDLHDAVLAAHWAIDALLTQGGEKLYDQHITELSQPFTVKFLNDLLLCVLEQQHIRREVNLEDEWPEVAEPCPCPIDTWARNAIPIVRKLVAPTPEHLMVLASDTRSMKSFKSGRSTRSAMGRRGVKKNTLSMTGKTTITIDETPQAFPMAVTPVVLTEEEEALRGKKENEIKRKMDEAARKKKMDDEMDELEKKLRKEAADMKHKPITYDCNGGIMYVNHPRYDTIPKLLTEAEYVPDRRPELPPLPSNSKKKRLVEDLRVKTAPVRETDWVKNMTALGPALFDVIKLNAGVTLSDNNRTKYPQITHSASQRTLTRRDYSQLALSHKSPAGLVPPLLDKKANLSQDSFKNSSRISSKRDALEDIPEYEGVDLIDESEEFEFQLKPSKSRGNVKTFGVAGKIDEENPIERFNKDIVKNKQWGANPALKKPLIVEKVKKKPDDRGMKDIYGDILKKPKDQPFITVDELWKTHGAKLKKPRDRPYVEKIEKKSRAPPPPYGFTMINALPEYEEWFKLNLDQGQRKPYRD